MAQSAANRVHECKLGFEELQDAIREFKKQNRKPAKQQHAEAVVNALLCCGH